MLDAKITPFIKPLLKPLISFLDQQGVAPNHVTLAGFVLGLLAGGGGRFAASFSIAFWMV